MSDFVVLKDFAFEAKAYKPGDVLHLSDPLEARLVREWPWKGFFVAQATQPTPTAPPAPARRRPKRDWLAEPPLWRLP